MNQGVPLFDTALNQRDAFRAIFSFGGSLSNLGRSAVNNVDAALNSSVRFCPLVRPSSSLAKLGTASRAYLRLFLSDYRISRE